MPNRFLLLVFCLLFVSQVYSQDKNVQFGIRAGLNLADITDFNFSDFNLGSRHFIHAGGYINYAATKSINFQLEILYSGKGGENPIIANGIEYKLKQNYLSLPILLQYRFNQFIIESGLEYSYKLSTEVISNIPDSNNYLQEEVWNKRNDFGLSLGLGYQLYRFTIGVRNTFGLTHLINTNITNENGDVIQQSGFAKNEVFQFNIAYQL